MRACVHRSIVLIALSWSATAHAQVCTPTLKWQWDGAVRSPAWPEPITAIVVQLTDDDGDGQITPQDVPDVVFTHSSGSPWSDAIITALDGQTGAEHFTITDPVVRSTALAAADIDGDGIVEIVAACTSCGDGLVAFEHTGDLKWVGNGLARPLSTWEPIAIADVDQDGSPEIVAGAQVVTADGLVRWQGFGGKGSQVPWQIRISNPIELDAASPGLEILAGNTLYAADGNILWQAAVPDGWTAVADFDRDGDPEIALVSGLDVYALDHLGNPIGAAFVPGGGLGITQPLIADLDGDGEPELFVGNHTVAVALELTAGGFAPLWTAPINDPSGVDGAAAFDFDGDGAAEIVFQDEESWLLLDGRTGATLHREPAVSGTGVETPIIADVDGVCGAEIIVPRFAWLGANMNTLTVYDCPGSIGARGIWNEYGYHGTNIDDDGTVPVVEQPPWQTGDGWLGQRASTTTSGMVADPGPPIRICEGISTTLDGSASSGCSTATIEYRWLDGTNVVCAWSGIATCDVRPSSSTTYTLEVRCPPATCSARATVSVQVDPCQLEVIFDSWFAVSTVAADGSRAIEIRWTTALEVDVLGYTVERADGAATPFNGIAVVTARGPGRLYSVIDEGLTPGSEPLYRVVELTTNGPGDATPAFVAAPAATTRTTGGRTRTPRFN